MLPNILKCSGRPPHQRVIWPQVSVVLRLRNSDLGKEPGTGDLPVNLPHGLRRITKCFGPLSPHLKMRVARVAPPRICQLLSRLGVAGGAV